MYNIQLEDYYYTVRKAVALNLSLLSGLENNQENCDEDIFEYNFSF